MGAATQLAKHFERNLGVPIPRSDIQTIGNQLDYMKRIRLNGGARDHLHPKGIAILWGKGDKSLITQLGIGPVADDEFIAFKPATASEKAKVQQAGHDIA